MELFFNISAIALLIWAGLKIIDFVIEMFSAFGGDGVQPYDIMWWISRPISMRGWYLFKLPMLLGLFVWLLRRLGEPDSVIKDFLAIKKTRMSIQAFQQLCHNTGFDIIDRRLYFINPHYEAKFGLTPRVLCKGLSCIPYVRDFFTTSCHYLIRKDIE